MCFGVLSCHPLSVPFVPLLLRIRGVWYDVMSKGRNAHGKGERAWKIAPMFIFFFELVCN